MNTNSLYDHTSQLMKDHQWKQVLKELDNQTLNKNKNWKLYWNAGWANYKINQFNEAIMRFKEAVELTNSPKDTAICLTFQGIAELGGKNYNQALESFKKSLKINDNSLARKSLGLVYMYFDNNEAAEQVHKEGIANEPENKERLAAYGDFLLDIGRVEEAREIERNIKNLE